MTRPFMSKLLGSSVATAAVLVVLPLPSATAAATGKLALLPARGTDRSALTLVTANDCPAGTNVLAKIEGAGFPSGGQNIVGNSAITAYDRTRTGGIRIPVSLVLRDIANLPAKAVVYRGSYRLSVICRDRVRVPELGRFTTTLTFSDPTHYRADNPSIATAVAPQDVSAGPVGPGLTNRSGSSSTPGGADSSHPQGSTGSALTGGSQPLANATSGGSDWVRWLGLGVLGLGVLGLSAGTMARLRRPIPPASSQIVPPHREKVT